MKSSLYLPVAVILLVTMAVATPAFANSSSDLTNSSQINVSNIYFLGNSGGAIVFNPSNQTLSMTSTLTEIRFGRTDVVGDFGTITFTTGALVSGSIFGTATFANGTYTITTNGTDGLPNGILFSGTLSDIHWREIGHTNQYFFSARGVGNIHDTSTLVSGTVQFNVGQGATVIPEPGTWALLGTGVLFVMGMVGLRALNRASTPEGGRWPAPQEP